MTPHFEDFGSGRPFLLLHGGAGPVSVASFGAHLAERRPARVLVPTHPGFNGTPRPDDIADAQALAQLYADLLEEQDLTDVTVVGNSLGGWIAAEMALLNSPRVAGVVIMNGVGITVPGHPIADFFSLTLPEVAELSYHEPDRFRIDPSTFTDAQKAAMAANRETLAVYAGKGMEDPTLAGRLAAVTVPTLVLWGQSDRMVDPDYGRAFAEAIPTATYRPLEGTGHLPQLETPDLALDAVWEFAAQL
ncbi:pimeloyl-ACP methyl ester carboxylesterase [Amycolatopsis bartoniae]|uniref:Alpha/beta hydrolase n=1 Tax=Amycolatopsis bartoniae TaxID=941986 RepID=A0A8H9IQ14_9PSEU|nr:alpha/beta hydrolase [Amycolatopsis bartoniae]MBB2934991.1 pimeloyl-ACP methyl ester carboxylesterase [Amycolatopsis bartoniae]TVT01968.1 alpha/beta hydrolase [Amycolatopsis bartoniae]GHF43258.1 alpha/beta hydrolase [Amycolatopsis bartoniae]